MQREIDVSSPELRGPLLFHGTRAKFTAFDLKFVGTGENAGPGIGMHFVDNLRGAAFHSGKCKGSGRRYVYVCGLHVNSVIIDRCVAPSQQGPAIQEIWDTLPVSNHRLFDDRDWFYNLDVHPYFLAGADYTDAEAQRCYFLQQHGIDAITDFEAGMQDGCYHGDIILLLSSAKLTIVERLPHDRIRHEALHPGKHCLKETKAFLPQDKVLSYLRRENSGAWGSSLESC